MTNIISLIIISISLSIDALCICIYLSTTYINKLKRIYVIIQIGIFHFFMPILGAFFGGYIKSFIFISTKYILPIILLLLGINILIHYKENIKNKNNYKYSYLFILALSVSLDSFSIGIGLLFSSYSLIMSPIFFSFFSMSFSYLGLLLGKYLDQKYHHKFKIISGILLIILSILHIIK